MPVFEHRLCVPFGHCDIAGIVYTPRFTEYCMEAAERFLRIEIGLDWYLINQERSCVNPVMHFEIDFHSSVKIADELCVTVRVSRIGNSSFELRFDGVKIIEESSVPCFGAVMVLVIVDADSKQSMTIPSQWREKLEACQLSG